MFLIALCVSIILEALTRFIDPPEITNPQLILAVGSTGLASNIVGYFVLGGHGHSHGPSDHSHGESGHDHDHDHDHAHEHSDLGDAEAGQAGHFTDAADETGRPVDVLPQVAVARLTASPSAEASLRHITFNSEASQSPTLARERSDSRSSMRGKDRRTPAGSRHGRLTSIENISIHPASFRQEIMDACEPHPEESSSESSQEDEGAVPEASRAAENTPLLGTQAAKGAYGAGNSSRRSRRDSGIHDAHNHSKPKGPAGKSHGHSHGDMGMNAMVLHVIGDALGNVGVIVTALVIWLAESPRRFYADPAVSLFITLIILRSAIPLTKTTSKVLLQATPTGIDAKQVQEDIESLPGVEACHDLHIWQLSDTTIVASLHVRVKFPITDQNGEKFMELSRRARRCLHAYGIHSATIQPEYWTEALDDVLARSGANADLGGQVDGQGSLNGGEVCLLECVDDCTASSCCVANKTVEGSGNASRATSSHSGHNHGGIEDAGHGHQH